MGARVGVRIVYVTTDRQDAAGLPDLLRAAGHLLVSVDDEAQLVRSIEQDPPHLVVICGTSPTPALLMYARAAASTAASPHVLLVHANLTDDFVAQVFEAGADGDLRLPLHPRGVASRLTAIRRRTAKSRAEGGTPPSRTTLMGVDWAATSSRDVGYVPRAPAVRPAPQRARSSIEQVARSAAWASACEHLREATSRFFSADVTTIEVPDDRELHGFGASIVLLSAEAQLEVRISVSMDPRSAQLLTDRVADGGDWVEMAQAMLDEVANLYMGTLQGAFTNAAFAFTSGLPEAVPASKVLRPPLPDRFQHAILLDVDHAELVVHVGLRTRSNVRITPRLLREGMVLAEDVMSARGTMLANRGTRLSAAMVERLRAHVAGINEIEVLSP